MLLKLFVTKSVSTCFLNEDKRCLLVLSELDVFGTIKLLLEIEVSEGTIAVFVIEKGVLDVGMLGFGVVVITVFPPKVGVLTPISVLTAVIA